MFAIALSHSHNFICEFLKLCLCLVRALLAQMNELGKKVEEANLTLGDFEKAKRKEGHRATIEIPGHIFQAKNKSACLYYSLN